MHNQTVRRLGTVTVLALLAGCAHTYQPVVDTQGVDQYKYQQDLAQCRSYAEQVNPWENAGIDTLIGAAGGAALGAATGAAVGAPAAGAAVGAAAGGIGGAGYGGISSANRQQIIINNCLRERGYRVLG
jgi:outer membrane lipoprotein SlyB